MIDGADRVCIDYVEFLNEEANKQDMQIKSGSVRLLVSSSDFLALLRF